MNIENVRKYYKTISYDSDNSQRSNLFKFSFQYILQADQQNLIKMEENLLKESLDNDYTFPDEFHTTIISKSEGKFLNNNIETLNNGILATLWNFPIRNNLWKFKTCAFRVNDLHNETNAFVLADERGQVYFFSIINNTYKIIRTASTPVSTMCFIESRLNEIIIAYKNGMILIINTEFHKIIANIQNKFNGKHSSMIKLIRTHPNKDIIILLDSNKRLYVWNIK